MANNDPPISTKRLRLQLSRELGQPTIDNIASLSNDRLVMLKELIGRIITE